MPRSASNTTKVFEGNFRKTQDLNSEVGRNTNKDLIR